MRADFHYIRTTGKFESDLANAQKHGNKQALERAYQKLTELLQYTQSAYTHGLDHKRIHGIHRVRMKGDWRAWFFPVTTDDGKQAWILTRLVKHEENEDEYRRIAAHVERFQNKHYRTIADSITGKASAPVDSVADLIEQANQYQQHITTEYSNQTQQTGGGGGGGGGGGKESILAPEVSIYDGQCIISKQEQDECINTLSRGIHADGNYIGAALGAPGAGKTYIIDKIAKQLDEPVYYIAESRRLRSSLERQWRNSPLCADGQEDHLQAKNYTDLLQAAGIINAETPIASNADVYRFIEGKLSAEHRVKPKQFLHECEIMAVCTSEEAYKALGHGHSMFKGNDVLQTRLWQLHQQLCESLTQTGKFHPSISSVNVTEAHRQAIPQTLLVDEALDYSRQQLLTLLNLGVKIIIVGDGNQDLQRSSATTKWLRAEIARRETTRSDIIKLGVSYRSSINAIAIANKLLLIKKRVTPHGDKLVDTEIACGTDRLGIVEVLKHKDVKQLQAHCQADKTAVIFDPADILIRQDKDKRAIIANLPEEAQLRFFRRIVREETGFDRCYTIGEFKGFGADHVVLYGMIPASLASQFQSIMESGKKTRDVISADEWELAEETNKLFTTVTRTKRNVYVVRTENTHKATLFYDWLMDGLEHEPGNEIEHEPQAEDWRTVVLDHLESDTIEMVSLAFDLAKKHRVDVVDCIRYLITQHAELDLIYAAAKQHGVIVPHLQATTAKEDRATITAIDNKKPITPKAPAKTKPASTVKPTIKEKASEPKQAKPKQTQSYAIEFSLPPMRRGELITRKKALKQYKSKHKTQLKRVIDFSQSLDLKTLSILVILPEEEFSKIQPHHIYKIMSMPVANTSNDMRDADLIAKKASKTCIEILKRLTPEQKPNRCFATITAKRALINLCLCIETEYNHHDSIQLLLDVGAHPDAHSEDFSTPLVVALIENHPETAMQLLANDPAPDIFHEGCDALSGEKQPAAMKLIADSYRESILPYIIAHADKYGINVNEPIKALASMRPLYFYIGTRSIKALNACLAKQADQCAICTKTRLTALHLAVMKGFNEAINLLDYHENYISLTTQALIDSIRFGVDYTNIDQPLQIKQRLNLYLMTHRDRETHRFTPLQLAELVSYNGIEKTLRAKAASHRAQQQYAKTFAAARSGGHLALPDTAGTEQDYQESTQPTCTPPTLG